MKPLYTHTLIVPFEDIDMMTVVWHGNYVRYFEQARCAWLADMGYTYLDMRQDGYIYPIVQLHVKYLKPLTFGEKIFIEIYLDSAETALKLSYHIKNAQGETLCKASTTQAAIDQHGHTQYQLHPELQTRIFAYLEQSS